MPRRMTDRLSSHGTLPQATVTDYQVSSDGGITWVTSSTGFEFVSLSASGLTLNVYVAGANL